MNSLVKIAKTALIGYVAYKAVKVVSKVVQEAVTETEVEETEVEVVNPENQEEVVTETVKKVVKTVNVDRAIKIAGGLCLAGLYLQNRMLVKRVGYIQTVVASNRFNNLLVADIVGLFDGPDRIKSLQTNLKAIRSMTNDKTIIKAVNNMLHDIQTAIGGIVYV